MLDPTTMNSRDLEELVENLKRQGIIAEIDATARKLLSELEMDIDVCDDCNGELVEIGMSEIIIKCRLSYGKHTQPAKLKKSVAKRHLDAFEAARVVIPDG